MQTMSSFKWLINVWSLELQMYVSYGESGFFSFQDGNLGPQCGWCWIRKMTAVFYRVLEKTRAHRWTCWGMCVHKSYKTPINSGADSQYSWADFSKKAKFMGLKRKNPFIMFNEKLCRFLLLVTTRSFFLRFWMHRHEQKPCKNCLLLERKHSQDGI